MSVHQGSPAQSRRVVSLAVLTVGLGLHLRAWFQLGPQLHEQFDIGLGDHLLLMGLPVLVAALVRLPVGVLTDRYGARVMFPAVSLAAAVPSFVLGLAGSLPTVVIAGAAAGVAGGSFVVGAAYVSKMFPYGRRGLALGVFSLGPAAAVAFSAGFRGFDPGGRQSTMVLGALLVGIAGLAALVLRDSGAGRVVGSPVRRCLELVRLASTTSLSLLYALALGGLVALAVYLPVYLTTAFGLGWFAAVAVTGSVVGLSAVARLAGAWWTDRRPTARVLMVCYAVAAGLCLAIAVQPRLWGLVAVIAVCDGVASGALLAMIGKAARPDNVGAVMGVTSMAAALGALVPLLLLVGVDRLSFSYSAVWVILAVALLAVALYVRSHGLRIGLGLAVQSEPAPSPTAMTVAVVGGSDTPWGTAAMVTRLAELAASDELVVVYGSDEPVQPRPTPNTLVTGLRVRLPRHRVVAVRVALRTGKLGRITTLLDEFVEAGTLTVAVTPTGQLRGVAAELSRHLHADRVLMVSYSLAEGAGLHEVWRRRPMVTSSG